MNSIYPFTSPVIMTDDIYQKYGGDLSVGSNEQFNVAYWLAEEAVTRDINTFLQPVTITGSFSYDPVHPFLLTYGYINYVDVIRFYDFKEELYYTITGTANIYASIRDKEYGILDIAYWIGNCACHSAALPYPYRIDVVYNAGFSSGTAHQPNILMALTTYTRVIMNEIVGYGNEAPGDIGVQSFSNQEYSEDRVKLINTVFGSSPQAQFAHRLLTPLRKRRYVSL